MPVDRYAIRIGADVLADLRARLANTRWPDQIPGVGWEQGTDLSYLRSMIDYWRDGFDWPAQATKLNAYPHYRAEIDGTMIHFVHARSSSGPGRPLILTHGWPSSFLEYLPLVDRLTARGFDLVIPSLPGYGFSDRPPRTGVTYRTVAGLWHRLMRSLGYDRYGAGGGDFGAGVATFMAMADPARVTGLHLTTMELSPAESETPAEPETPAERAYAAETARWADSERGYSAIQSTKPQTLGYGLTDSPAGLAAWILEKWRSWTDSGGDLDASFDRDFLLTMLTVYWATGSITTSIRDYYDNRWFADLPAKTPVPTAFALGPRHFVPEGEPPREWAERLYTVRRWTVLPRGGHFVPVEEPDLVADDIAAFYDGL